MDEMTHRIDLKAALASVERYRELSSRFYELVLLRDDPFWRKAGPYRVIARLNGEPSPWVLCEGDAKTADQFHRAWVAALRTRGLME
jgi:hypothetical protein